MRTRLIGTGCLLIACMQSGGLAQAAPPCSAPRAVIERFMSADCEACWSAAPAEAPPGSTWVLDWIASTASGSAAPLAVAALSEAGGRLEALASTVAADKPRAFHWPIERRPAVRLRVGGGPAWNGYLGLQLQTRGKPPAGAVAYLALVENIPAGSDGSPVARRLLRNVAGPLVIEPSGRPSTQWRALRIPAGAQPERLQGVAWWVDGDARLRGIAAEGCAPTK